MRIVRLLVTERKREHLKDQAHNAGRDVRRTVLALTPTILRPYDLINEDARYIGCRLSVALSEESPRVPESTSKPGFPFQHNSPCRPFCQYSEFGERAVPLTGQPDCG
jgi:hypothetical protein